MKKGKLRAFIIIVLVGIIVFSAWNIIKIQMEYKEGNDLYENARKEFMTVPEEGSNEGTISVSAGEEKEIPLDKRINFEKLKEVNDDIVGWINIPGTTVDYPLLMNVRSNDDYIYTTYDGKYSGFGSIFIDYRNLRGFVDENTVIYGHNMQNGAMFGQLMKFGKGDFADSNRYVYILTENGIDVYEVYSAYRTLANSSSYDFRFDTEKSYQNFLNMTVKNSVINNDVEISVNDRIITMSTCTDTEITLNRFVVHAKYVETRTSQEDI